MMHLPLAPGLGLYDFSMSVLTLTSAGGEEICIASKVFYIIVCNTVSSCDSRICVKHWFRAKYLTAICRITMNFAVDVVCVWDWFLITLMSHWLLMQVVHFSYKLIPTGHTSMKVAMDSHIHLLAGANPSWHWVRGGVHPGQVASQSQHIETDKHANQSCSHSHLQAI